MLYYGYVFSVYFLKNFQLDASFIDDFETRQRILCMGILYCYGLD